VRLAGSAENGVGSTDMKTNNVRAAWREGKAVASAWLHIPTAYTAEICAGAGFDVITIDMQHGPVDYQSAVDMMISVQGSGVTPFVRVPWNEPTMVQRVLDGGAQGIICPMVNNRAECERFVGACKYPPLGFRSNGAYRALRMYGSDYMSGANDFVIAMAMVETREAFEKLDEILDTPGLDAIFVGPSDLSISMYGFASADHTTAPMLGHIEEIARKAKAKGIPAGLYTLAPEYAKRAIGMGYQFVTCAGDDGLLAAAFKAAAQGIKS